MLNAYVALGRIHFKLENLDEAMECFKFQLTLAKILNIRDEKLSSLTMIGRIFSKKGDFSTAIKVLAKARYLGETLNAKQELALCYGYLGECHMAIGNQAKVNFMLPIKTCIYYFDFAEFLVVKLAILGFIKFL